MELNDIDQNDCELADTETVMINVRPDFPTAISVIRDIIAPVMEITNFSDGLLTNQEDETIPDDDDTTSTIVESVNTEIVPIQDTDDDGVRSPVDIRRIQSHNNYDGNNVEENIIPAAIGWIFK